MKDLKTQEKELTCNDCINISSVESDGVCWIFCTLKGRDFTFDSPKDNPKNYEICELFEKDE